MDATFSIDITFLMTFGLVWVSVFGSARGVRGAQHRPLPKMVGWHKNVPKIAPKEPKMTSHGKNNA